VPPSVIVDRRGVGAEKWGRDRKNTQDKLGDRATVAGAEVESFERGRGGGGGGGGKGGAGGGGEGGGGGGGLGGWGAMARVLQVSLAIAGLMSDPERLQQVALGWKVLLLFCTEKSHLW
jgi:hypothetical protein